MDLAPFGRRRKGQHPRSLHRPLRGQFYSFLAVLIVIPVMLFLVGTLTSLQESSFSVNEKIVADQLKMVEKSIEEDFHKGAETAFKRSLLAATNHVITNGTFFSNVYMAVAELMIDGTLYGKPNYLMTNNTLTYWKSSILNISTGFEVDFNFTYPLAGTSGTDMIGSYALDISVRNRFGTSSIVKTGVPKSYRFSFEGFEDPFFPLSTYGLVRRQYKAYPYPFYARKFAGTVASQNQTGNVTFNASETNKADSILVTSDISGQSGWKCVVGTTGTPAQACYVLGVADAVNGINQTVTQLNYSTIYIDNKTDALWSLPLVVGIENGHYYPGYGPHVFDRLEGKFANSSVLTFITIVKIPDLQAAGVAVRSNQDLVDWVYLGGYAEAGYPVRGFPAWFRAGNGTQFVLNITELGENP